MPQDAAFCAVSCGSILSRASQNETHHSAKRGKMRQIEAAKSSRKVVKRDFSTTRILLPVCSKADNQSSLFLGSNCMMAAICRIPQYSSVPLPYPDSPYMMPQAWLNLFCLIHHLTCPFTICFAF